MLLTSYTQQPYSELPECFAGWMSRAVPESGEVFEPRTVQDRFDLTADTRVSIPLVFDLCARKAVWCDLALKNTPTWSINVHSQLRGIHITLKSMLDLNKPNLFDLFSLHAMARGEIVGSPELADTVFSVDAGTPFRIEEIASQYMG